MLFTAKPQAMLQWSQPAPPSLDRRQLRRDRWTAILVVTVTAALMALLVWLASLGGGGESSGGDYWHLMP